MDFEDLIPKKDSGEDLQPPVAAASVNFEDLVPGELEETSVLSIGNPYREQRGAFYPGSTDIYGNLMFDSNQLGEESLGTFYPAQGFAALHNMINMKPESLENFIIMDDKGKNYTITEFLDVIEKLKIKKA